MEEVLTDNGGAYIAITRTSSPVSTSRSNTAAQGHTGRRRTGKAERFIRTLLSGRAYGAIYRSGNERTAALDGWPWHYNHQRKHSALNHRLPISRTNLPGSYI